MQNWKDVENEFIAFFTVYGKDACIVRLTDTAAAKAVGGKRAFVQAQPSDFLLTFKGVTHYVEVKSTKSETSFPFGNIQKGQWAASRKIVGAQGSYLFFIKNLNTVQWYIVPAEVLHAQRPAKSIKWTLLEDYKWTTPI